MNQLENDVNKSAEVFLNELLRHQKGESILVYVDQGSDPSVARAIKIYAEKRGGHCEIFALNSELALAEQARQLTEKIRQGSFNAICELSEQYFYLTSAWKEALEIGARIFSLAGLDAASFVRCVGKVNHEGMFRFGMALKNILQGVRQLHIHTQNGTDIQMQLSLNPFNRLAARFKRGRRAFIWPPCGILDDKTRTTFLGGQLSFLGIPSTIEGTAVIDGYLWPPAEIGLLDEPIIMKIEKGRVTEIGGSPAKSKSLKEWFKGQTIHVEHFCFGFNPGARLSGKILEAERSLGCFTVGIGRGFFHTDGIIKSPSIEADGKVIEEKGSFISGELLSLNPPTRN